MYNYFYFYFYFFYDEDDEETNDKTLTFSQHFSKKSNTFLKNTNNQSKINIDKLGEEVE